MATERVKKIFIRSTFLGWKKQNQFTRQSESTVDLPTFKFTAYDKQFINTGCDYFRQ